MHRNHLLAIILSIAAALLLSAADDPPPTPASPEIQSDLSAALSDRLAAPGASLLTFDLFSPELDVAFTSPDGTVAVLWLALRDDSGRLLATEPGLALGILNDGVWQVLLPGDSGWDETLANLPAEMLPVEISPAPEGVSTETIAPAALSGYYLPYAAGTARWLEGSISHFQSIPELGYPSCAIEFCHYAYDFTHVNHFPLLASKAGTVYKSRETCADGSTGCTNFIVLRNAAEGTYQIYLHLSQGTIPDKLTEGTAVKRGEYLGDTDDTGYSTSNHVHFMVTNTIWLSANADKYYWGYSIDIRFADVAINNGIPRTCYEVTHFQIYDGATECLGNKADPRNPNNDWFISGNIGAYPPGGAFARPVAGATVSAGTNPAIDVTVNATDDVRVTAVRLLVKVNGQWVEAGPMVTQSTQVGQTFVFDWDANLCAVGPLNGPVEVAFRAWDHEGNVSGALDAHTIQVDHACPPPTSQLLPAETFNSTALRLNWNASEAGAGLGSFELQWRTAGSAWNSANTLTIPAAQRSIWFSGQGGVTNEFRMRALDANGQPEPWPAGDAAEISVALPGNCTPDGFENDDNLAQAKALVLRDSAFRNLCAAADPDWFQLTVGNAGNYLVSAPSLGGGAAVRITVYAANGTTVLGTGQANDMGQAASARFRAEQAGVYYLKIEALTPSLYGTQAVYGVSVWDEKLIYLPVVGR